MVDFCQECGAEDTVLILSEHHIAGGLTPLTVCPGCEAKLEDEDAPEDVKDALAVAAANLLANAIEDRSDAYDEYRIPHQDHDDLRAALAPPSPPDSDI